MILGGEEVGAIGGYLHSYRGGGGVLNAFDVLDVGGKEAGAVMLIKRGG
jgi:hypothetical protein